tara:strand:- start:79 stop:231 length:153 start_codon:yes stop_codon:yes gene_type:complete
MLGILNDLRRSELLTTEMELRAIASAAHSGLRVIPQTLNTPAARGMLKKL